MICGRQLEDTSSHPTCVLEKAREKKGKNEGEIDLGRGCFCKLQGEVSHQIAPSIMPSKPAVSSQRFFQLVGFNLLPQSACLRPLAPLQHPLYTPPHPLPFLFLPRLPLPLPSCFKTRTTCEMLNVPCTSRHSSS